MTPSTKGFFALGSASAIWGGMYVASDALMKTVPPFVLLELREAISAAVMIAIAWRSKKVHIARRDYPLVISCGLIGFTISIGLQFTGTHYAGAAIGSLVTASSPVFIAILGAIFLAESVPLRRWIAIGVALLGVVVVVGSPTQAPKATSGVLLLGGAAIAWAIYTVQSASLLKRYPAVTVVGAATLVGAVTSLPLAAWSFANSPHPLPATAVGWAEIAYVSLAGMTLAFFLWVWGFKHVPASRGGVMLLFQPIFGIVLGTLLLGESLGLITSLGALLVCVGVGFALWESREKLPATALDRQS